MKSRFALVATAVVIVAAAAFGAVQLWGRTAPRPVASPVVSTPSVDARPSVSTAATTPAVVSPAPNIETSPTPAPAPTPPPSPAPTTTPARTAVDVVVTIAGWNALDHAIEVAAYVPVLEPNASCTLTASRSGVTRTYRTDAVRNASTMSCGALSAPRTDLTPGTWQVVVAYDSATSHGVTQARPVEVPQ